MASIVFNGQYKGACSSASLHAAAAWRDLISFPDGRLGADQRGGGLGVYTFEGDGAVMPLMHERLRLGALRRARQRGCTRTLPPSPPLIEFLQARILARVSFAKWNTQEKWLADEVVPADIPGS